MYEYNPLQIEAFQWELDAEFPDWFMDMKESGKIFVVLNLNSDSYIFVENKRGKYKGMISDWICRDEFGHVFIISQKTFNLRVREVSTKGEK